MSTSKSETAITHADPPANSDHPSLEANLISVTQSAIDIADLPEATKIELKAEMTRKMIESADRQVQLGQDVQALGASLGTMASASAEMSQEGLTMTVSNTRDDNLGRTEVLIGNSDAAQRGKLTRTQSGGSALSLSSILLIGSGIAAVTIIAVSLAQ